MTACTELISWDDKCPTVFKTKLLFNITGPNVISGRGNHGQNDNPVIAIQIKGKYASNGHGK